MAKIVKDERKVMDVDLELAKIKNETKSTSKKKENNKSNTHKNKSNKKHSNKKKSSVFQFFKEVKNEISKVKWPSKKDMLKYSIATILFIIFFAVFFYLIDLIIALLKAGV